jgi:SAM-dependent methyltransferase
VQHSSGSSRPSEHGHGDTLWIRVGKLRPVPVRYLESSGRFYVMPTGEGSEWAILALQVGKCAIRRSGEPERMSATAYVTEPSRVEALRTQFRAAVGEELWKRYFEDQRKILELDPAGIGMPLPAPDLIEAEFDASAASYDTAIGRHSVDRYLKNRVTELLSIALRGIDPLLEIGPGTGFHTLPLLAEGHRVRAIDLSSRMLSLLQDRASTMGTVGRLETSKGRLGELPTLCHGVPDGAYGAIYSAFGAFNLEPDMQDVGPTLARLLRPGGRLLFTTLNRPGLVPFAWDLLLGHPKSAAGRLHEQVPAGELRYPLALSLRTPGEWDRILGVGFHRVVTRAVSALAPPFDSPRIDHFLGRQGSIRMAGLDESLSKWGPAWRLAEWVWLVYERVQGTSPPSKL